MFDPNWHDLPSLSSLRAFEATARSGSFAAAARTLNVTQAAVAQQVRGLETELGVTLARRAGRSVALTETGKQFAARLNEGFSAVAAAVAEVRHGQSEQPVQVSATPFIAQAVVLPRLHEFWKKLPDVQVSLLPSIEWVDISERGFDLAIRASVDPPDWPDLNAELLCESQMIVVGAPELIGEGKPDLRELPWIWNRGTGYEERRFRSMGLDPETLVSIDLGSPIFEISAAVRGLGVVVSPEILVREEIAAGQLCPVEVPGLKILRYYAVTPKGPIRLQTSQFIKWLVSIFSD